MFPSPSILAMFCVENHVFCGLVSESRGHRPGSSEGRPKRETGGSPIRGLPDIPQYMPSIRPLKSLSTKAVAQTWSRPGEKVFISVVESQEIASLLASCAMSCNICQTPIQGGDNCSAIIIKL